MVILFGFVAYARKGGGGRLGQKIRSSDHWALEDAIRDKGEEIARLEQEREELINLRPKYKI